MRQLLFLALLLMQCSVNAQMRVYNVAGSLTSTALGDGGPATNARLLTTEGIGVDGYGNVYICDMTDDRIRKVDKATGTITTLIGNGHPGDIGDGGLASSAQAYVPYGIFVDNNCDVYFTNNTSLSSRIRRIDGASGIVSTFAGGGTSTVDGAVATDFQLNGACNVYGDKNGNIYVSEHARILKIAKSTGIVSTIAGNGIPGLSGDGGLATAALLSGTVCGLVFDTSGNLYISDRGNSRIRVIEKSTGIIRTVAGTTYGYSGDGGPATSAQLAGPMTTAIDKYGNLIIGDNENNVIRVVDVTGKIQTVAGVGTGTVGSYVDGDLATAAEIHPEFIFLDYAGDLYFSDYGPQVRRITNFNPGINQPSLQCGFTSVGTIAKSSLSVFPDPADNELHVETQSNSYTKVTLLNSVGQELLSQPIVSTSTTLNLKGLPTGIYTLCLYSNTTTERRVFLKR